MKQFIVGLSMLAVIVTTVSARADITIGVNLSTTGPAASLGIGQKNGILIGGPSVIAGQKVNYIFFDDATDATTAVQNVKRLITESKIDVLVGPSMSPTSRAVIDTVAESKTPMIQLS